MYLLAVTKNGYGLLTRAEYPVRHRNVKGVRSITTSFTGEKRNGEAAVLRKVDNFDQDVFILSAGGMLVRFPVSELRISQSNNKGIRLIDLSENDFVADVTIL